MERLPVVFFGHGSPMNALGGRWAEGWTRIGAAIPKPRAVLMVSAHWYVEETAVTAMARPRTIHDFGGFPEPLYRLSYPAPGDPALAAEIARLLAPLSVRLDQDWGLDHGAWSVLMHAYPEADIPVLQLAVDRRAPGDFHFDLGRRLAPLREAGVLIAGSGDVVHNLRASRIGGGVPAHDWALRFDALVRGSIESGRWEALADWPALGPEAELSIPTPDHYLPLLYVLGAAAPGEPLAVHNAGIDLGAISMTSYVIGA